MIAKTMSFDNNLFCYTMLSKGMIGLDNERSLNYAGRVF